MSQVDTERYIPMDYSSFSIKPMKHFLMNPYRLGYYSSVVNPFLSQLSITNIGNTFNDMVNLFNVTSECQEEHLRGPKELQIFKNHYFKYTGFVLIL